MGRPIAGGRSTAAPTSTPGRRSEAASTSRGPRGGVAGARRRPPPGGRPAAPLSRRRERRRRPPPPPQRPPLRAANRSVAERWAKWRRRSPQALHRLVVLALVVAVAVALVAQGLVRRDKAGTELAASLDALDHDRSAEALRAAESGLDRLARWPGDPSLRRRSRRSATSTAARPATSCTSWSRASVSRPCQRLGVAARTARSLCFPRRVGGSGFGFPPDGQRRPVRSVRVAADLLDLALFDADLAVKLADPSAPGRPPIASAGDPRRGRDPTSPGLALAEARRSHAECSA